MKNLRRNPVRYYVELTADEINVEDGYAQVELDIGDLDGHICVTAAEAKAIGEWFLKLAKELKK